MSGSLLPVSQQWFDNNGNPLADGFVYTYVAGTSTLKASYSDYALSSLNTNPVELDAAGRADIWGAGGYKIVVKTADGSTLYTQDYVFLSGSTDTVVGDFTQSGGKFRVDTTAYTPIAGDPFGAVFTNDNVYLNIDTYGSGATCINHQDALNNNQPSFFVINNNAFSNFGNSAALEACNVAGGYNAGFGAGVNASLNTANHIEVGIELIAPMTAVNAYNGKFKISSVSGRSGSTAIDADGYTYFGTRRSALHPSGANTGFEDQLRIHTMSTIGKGWMVYEGLGVQFVPAYDFTGDATISMLAQYQNALLQNKSTFGTAVINNISTAAASKVQIVNRSSLGGAEIFNEANDGTSDSTLNMRANWTTPGTGDVDLNMYTDNTSGNPSGWSIGVTGQSGPTTSNLFFTNVVAGVSTTVAQLNTNSSFVLYNAASPYLQLQSNTGGTGRTWRINTDGATSALNIRDQTANDTMFSVDAVTVGGKTTAHHGLKVGKSGSATYRTAGTATLTAGEVTVSTAAVNANSLIFVVLRTFSGAVSYYAAPNADRVAGTSFKIKALDSAGATVAADVSTVDWLIVDNVT